MKTVKHLLLSLSTIILGLAAAQPAGAQEQMYFVDGFHGGVYGHYPIRTYTDYMLDLLDKHPEWRMCLEIEPETWDTVKVKAPKGYERLVKVAADDRIEFTNPSYAQPYMYNVSGESIIRQFEYGMKKVWGHFPDVEFVTYSVEEPCFTSALPQILAQFGFKYASLKCPNTCWGGYASAYGNGLVNWIGPDGTSILTAPRYAIEDLDDKSVWSTIANDNRDSYVQACQNAGIVKPVGMTYQDAGWQYGPWIGNGDNIKGNSIYVTWREYFEKITDGRSDDDYHFTAEDVLPGLMWGSQVLQTLSQQIRATENNITMTEKLGAIAALRSGYRYDQAQIDEAWRVLLLSQHHDCWIVPYNRLNRNGSWADNVELWTAKADKICMNLTEDIADSFAGGKGRDNETYLRVFNTLGHARKEIVSLYLPEGCASAVVKDPKGKVVPSVMDMSQWAPQLSFMSDVPAFGYAVYTITMKDEADKSCRISNAGTKTYRSGEVVVENAMYRLVFDADRGGVITSLFDKTAGTEYQDAKSAFRINELRGFFYEDGGFRSSAETPAEILVDDTGLVKTVKVRGEIAGVPFVQTVVLTDGDRKIECSVKVDWKKNKAVGRYPQKDAYGNPIRAFYQDAYKLNVLFPVAIEKPSVYKDAPFDVAKSRHKNTDYESWYNIKHNVLLNWVDLVGGEDKGFAVFCDHTNSYTNNEDYPLALTVQYTGNGLWGRNYPVRYPTEINYAIVPHQGLWSECGLNEESLNWNEPLLCSEEKTAARESVSYMETSEGLTISAAYMTDEGLLVRVYNTAADRTPSKVSFGFAVKSVEEIDLNGEHVSDVRVTTSGGRQGVDLDIPQFGIRTYLVK